ncbi:hypothetical protein ASPZODRAFT_152475 [Penicilliopsis zonata CBS 506.65]|uniref:Carboxylic ester hydrolase n=1 Tax=Penicilliopsis zonata CBS 506.65 TaxID=1073090 RepID=A0A1L9SGP4_9EURO|nr:hypothetical protein ASPZODRAFT_152475 [Penicilliopsis zonata CBS 506.65]OJJ46293.1 hypothetical protein ASPZODRAFT_152475 [Penicilliopsis zonata CBS 506.65]
MLCPWLVFLTLISSVTAVDTLVNLDYSVYDGRALANGITQWLGMRFAAPPVESLRFAAPQDPEVTVGVQNATQHGPLCIPTSKYPVPSGTSEDCLFLDVYAPSNASNTSDLPVFFWIHGGGFSSDSNTNYNGSGLIEAADMSIVIVTFNYRLGPYGFLGGSQVAEGASVNNGIKDMLKALEWVQHHIRKFGGNPNHVVLGGDSAGAGAVTLLLSAYGGRNDGLFHAAAAESQSFATMLTVNQSQFEYDNLVIRTGCAGEEDTLACLRGLNVSTLQQQNINTAFPNAQAAPLYMYGPVVDGDLIPDVTYRLFEQGRFVHVPVIFGDDTNEGTIFVPTNTSSVGQANTFIQTQFPSITLDQLRQINAWYLQPNETEAFPDAGIYWRPTSNAYGDIRYLCPGIFLSATYAAAGLPSWNYHYAVVDPTQGEEGYGTPHTVEVNAIWGPQYVSAAPPDSYFTSNAAIVPVMQGYWTSFIRSLDPNPLRAEGTPEWLDWGSHDDAYRRIYFQTNATAMESVPPTQRERCAYLSGIGVQLRQ